MKRIVLVVLLMTSTCGCPVQRRPRVKPDVNIDIVAPIDVDKSTATAIHKGSAAKRAEIYIKLADAVKAGTLKTVNDVVAFYNPLVTEVSDEYLKDINALRKSRLHDSDDTLPSNAEDVFRLFAKEYSAASR